MQLVLLEAAVIFGIVIPQISSIGMLSVPPDCLAAVDTCMSDLCKSEQAFYNNICDDEGCQTKGSEVCNMTIQFVLDQFPSLRGCVCSWKGELCGSIQALATQCRTKPAAQQKWSSGMDWQSSHLIGTVYDGVGSCLDQMRACVSDSVCNRHLAPVLQACKADPCVSERCQQVTQQFYGSMPHNVAEMLVMCECDDLDQSCQDMKATLHTGTCGDEMWICQDTVNQCAHDSNCRHLLKTFQVKCWRSEESQCSGSDLQDIDCFTQMDPALILGTDSECKAAFLATLGTDLHHPCSCEGVGGHDLLTCNRIFHLFHNRSHFLPTWKPSNDPPKPPGINEPEPNHTWIPDYLLYAFAIMLLVGVVVLMPLAVVTKIWMLRREKNKFHPLKKSSCVNVL
ncbi:GDNF family receptor alpha-like [Mastacembelus armatus]|uniref:GDNF family receptor alpha-like n=1 Tax=Mastacembelus armatus TaxID=205130 RepID=UPI000E4585CE|nr:GDNF family receptor alpha-like [Mastacembelus armatus]